MPSLDTIYPELTAALADHYGRPPVDRPDAPFAALLGALLARTLDARKTRLALDTLHDTGLLDPAALAEADRAEVADALKRSGVGSPARLIGPLERVARWFLDRDDSLDLAATETLREELAAINGIGPATADAILLHGLGRPAYPVDTATYRILARHGWIDPGTSYEDARDTVERCAPDNPPELAHVSAWFTRIGAEFCRASRPRCERCPLAPWLPDGGPVAPDDHF